MLERFQAQGGAWIPAITADQMRDVDDLAVEKYGPNLFQMMENAGRNLAELAKELLGKSWQKAKIAVLAGTGGNGGGGICAARHLVNHGGKVQLAITNSDRLTGVPAHQRYVFLPTGGSEVELGELKKPDIILDAIIGYSLVGAPRGESLRFIEWANSQNAQRLCLDVPSGLDPTSGDTPGAHIRADATLTLALPKTGLLPDKTGDLYLGDIGIPPAVYEEIDVDYTPPFSGRYVIELVKTE